MNAKDREWLQEQLHSKAMKCRQCELIKELLSETE